MDNNRFDNLTRLLGEGTDRRRVLRMLFGGAGALTVAGATGRLASAEACDPNAGDITCPPGSHHAGKSKKPDGGCCNGNGNCCSNICTGGVCVSGSSPECETAADCGAQPDSCTEWLCVDGTCELNGGCPADELCCPAQGGSCAECCDNSDCPTGAPICYNPGDPTNAYCVECVVDGDCGPCESCQVGTCVPYARYCEATQLCYDPSTDGCCPGTEDGCGSCYECSSNSTCVAIECGQCESCEGGTCTPYAEYCEEGDYCYSTMEGGCCTDSECGDDFCIDRTCSPCPSGTEYCPEDGGYCYSTMTGGCCTDSECGAEVCTDRHCCPPGDNFCPDGDYCYSQRTGGCCTDDECGDCQSCHDGVCGGDCSQSEECCYGECVPFDTCCQGFGDTCGVLEVTSAGGDRQYDCCDGLLCCFGQSTNVCGECCADSDCKAAPGGVCNAFQCEYPTCEGKYETCHSDSECCHGLKCRDGVCKHPRAPHKPHKPHKPSKPSAPVETLPATGVKNGGNDAGNALGVTLAASAAALLAAKHLRQTSTEEAGDEA